MELCPFCSETALVHTGEVVEDQPVIRCLNCYGSWISIELDPE